MATYEELREAINDYVEQTHKSARVTRALRNWNCVVYIEADDLEQGFTLTVRDSRATMQDGPGEKPDLIVRGPSEDLADIFWCDVNPTSTYMQGMIKAQGSPENVMRLDAISMLIFLELHKE